LEESAMANSNIIAQTVTTEFVEVDLDFSLLTQEEEEYLLRMERSLGADNDNVAG